MINCIRIDGSGRTRIGSCNRNIRSENKGIGWFSSFGASYNRIVKIIFDDTIGSGVGVGNEDFVVFVSASSSSCGSVVIVWCSSRIRFYIVLDFGVGIGSSGILNFGVDIGIRCSVEISGFAVDDDDIVIWWNDCVTDGILFISCL